MKVYNVDEENIEYIVNRLLKDSKLNVYFNMKLSSIELWYQETGIKCPTLEIYNQVFEQVLERKRKENGKSYIRRVQKSYEK